MCVSWELMWWQTTKDPAFGLEGFLDDVAPAALVVVRHQVVHPHTGRDQDEQTRHVEQDDPTELPDQHAHDHEQDPHVGDRPAAVAVHGSSRPSRWAMPTNA